MKTKCCHSSHYHVVDYIQVCLNKNCDSYLGITTCYKDFTKSRKATTLIIFVLTFLFSFDDFSRANKRYESGMPSAFISEQLPISIENIEEELKRLEVICHKEVLAQIKIESGHLSSYLLRRTNNMLGMRYPFKRPTTASGIYLPESDTIISGNQKDLRKHAGKNHYAVYKSWQDAVADYKLWQDSNFKVKEKYLEFLGNTYAEDTMYISKIKHITKRLN